MAPRTISIHALLAESDPFSRSGPMMHPYFYPRSPCGERQVRAGAVAHREGISIHALLAESDWCISRKIPVQAAISIHALLAESDALPYFVPALELRFLSTLSLRRATGAAIGHRLRHNDFYPRSPCGERQNSLKMRLKLMKFLSTLSLRRATGLDGRFKL